MDKNDNCPSGGAVAMSAFQLSIGGPMTAIFSGAATVAREGAAMAGITQILGHDIPRTDIETVAVGLACHGNTDVNNPSTLPRMSPGGG